MNDIFNDNNILLNDTKYFLKNTDDLISIFNNGITKSIPPVKINNCYNTLKDTLKWREKIFTHCNDDLSNKLENFGLSSKINLNIESLIHFFDDNLSISDFHNFVENEIGNTHNFLFEEMGDKAFHPFKRGL